MITALVVMVVVLLLMVAALIYWIKEHDKIRNMYLRAVHREQDALQKLKAAENRIALLMNELHKK